MQCSNPKKIYVKKNGTEYPIFVPCGKCYACQNQSRAEWAIRCKYELKNSACAAFITLTYDNDKLPHTCSNNTFKHLVSLEMLKPISERRWDFARLDKFHVQVFCSKMQKLLKKTFGNKKLLFRWFISGEFGDITHRPHAHAVCFSPVELNNADWTQFVKQCWHFGNIDVQTDVNMAVVNYVAKHQIKTCLGTPEQQRETPNFKIVSRYLGGIGFNMKNDIDLINRYNDDEVGNFIDNLQGQISYTIAFPRFLLRHLRNYRNLEEYELSYLSHVSRENMERQVYDMLLLKPELAVYKFNGDLDFDKTVASVRHFTKNQDSFRRREYERKKRVQKVNKFINKSNSVNYEHI